MTNFKHFFGISAILIAIVASPTLAITDTIYVQKRITDTLYVVSPPDTVYIQESTAQHVNTEVPQVTKNEFLLDYSTDTIQPGFKFYIGNVTSLNLFSIWFGAPILDLTWELENTYRGSLLFNLSSIMLFGEFNIRDEDPTWEGFRSIVSPGIGYRQYLITLNITRANPKKRKVKFRNTPLNSFSFYVQALGSPTLKIAYDKAANENSKKSGSFDAGVSISASLGSVWNMGNTLWDMGFTFGYQYWGDSARRYLSWNTRSDEEINYHILNGWADKGLFFGTEIKIGF